MLPYKDHLAEELERSGVRCHCLSGSPADVRWPIRLRHLLAEGNFDVVHAHSPLPATAARLLVRSFPVSRRPAMVTTEHNAWNTFALPTRWANWLTVSLDHAVYAVSRETRSSMDTTTQRRCITLAHGIDVASVAAQAAHREEARAELGIGTHEFVIGTVANFREQKDYPNLLRATQELRDLGVTFRVVAVGQGPGEQEIRDLVDQLGLNDNVLLLGYRPDATSVMSGFDVFTLASKWEGLPVALMEALALGLPVVATAVGGVAEALAEDDAILVRRRSPRARQGLDAVDRLVRSSCRPRCPLVAASSHLRCAASCRGVRALLSGHSARRHANRLNHPNHPNHRRPRPAGRSQRMGSASTSGRAPSMTVRRSWT